MAPSYTDSDEIYISLINTIYGPTTLCITEGHEWISCKITPLFCGHVLTRSLETND